MFIPLGDTTVGYQPPAGGSSSNYLRGDDSWGSPAGLVTFVSKAANYTPLSTDYVVVFTATATATLNSALPAGTTFKLKLSAAATGGSVLTLTPSSGTIENVSSLVLNILGDAAEVVYDGVSNWNVF
jgi:hypothetical protein